MQIKEASDKDIPEIIEVLKASLGETKLRKSERIWSFKHLDNPFGKSLVLVAVEDSKIIGVRAFMRWRWCFGEREFSSFRAVDTATHPEHQGKGVFKKLTLKAIEIAKGRGDHLIFNTPNSQSLPGYLKMGWEEVGKLKVRLIPVSPLKWKFNKAVKKGNTSHYSNSEEIQSLARAHNVHYGKQRSFFTPKSREFLRWRYEANPLQKYEVLSGKGFYLAAYTKEHKYFNELRIVEHLYQDSEGLRNLKKQVKILIENTGIQVISFGNIGESTSALKIRGEFGPVLTFRNLTLEKELQDKFLSLENWSYSLGDLELF